MDDMDSLLAGLTLEQIDLALEELDKALSAEGKAAAGSIIWDPYPKQREFHALGATKKERLLCAGNQAGKTLCASAEIAYHLTGDYPDWWEGRRWDRPTFWWAGADSYELTKVGVQTKLFGKPGTNEAGMIPQDRIISRQMSRSCPEAFDSVLIRYKNGGISKVEFKAYSQGRARWQAATIDGVWCDEEPPEDVYFEALTRVTATSGMIMVTFTPLSGLSAVVRRFFDEESADRGVVKMGLYDAPHLAGEIESLLKLYPPHERQARLYGEPCLGSGAVFTTPDEDMMVPLAEEFTIPKHWPRMIGIDFGIDHPSAAVALAWDRENDVVYAYKCYRAKDKKPYQHVEVIGRGEWVGMRVAWPADGLQRGKSDGKALKDVYKDLGLDMLPMSAKMASGSVSVDEGCEAMDNEFATGQFKWFESCKELWEEKRGYYRKAGKIVALRDDAISACRYGWVMLKQFGKPRKNAADRAAEKAGAGARKMEKWDGRV